MEHSRSHFRQSLLYLFDSKKIAAEANRMLVETYGEFAPSSTTCKEWFQRFKKNDFDVAVDNRRSIETTNCKQYWIILSKTF